MAWHDDYGWLLIVLVPLLGVVYGRLYQGWQNKGRMLGLGIAVAALVALLLALVGVMDESVVTQVFALLILGVVLVILFVAGVWGGDALETRARRKRGEEPVKEP